MRQSPFHFAQTGHSHFEATVLDLEIDITQSVFLYFYFRETAKRAVQCFQRAREFVLPRSHEQMLAFIERADKIKLRRAMEFRSQILRNGGSGIFMEPPEDPEKKEQ